MLPQTSPISSRLPAAELDNYLGEGVINLPRGGEELQRAQGAERAGREFYPFLAVLLALVLGLEQAFLQPLL